MRLLIFILFFLSACIMPQKMVTKEMKSNFFNCRTICSGNDVKNFEFENTSEFNAMKMKCQCQTKRK